MNDIQIQARAIVASALIHNGMLGGLTDAEAFDGPKGAQLRGIVDAVFRAVINPQPPKGKAKRKR